MNIQFNLHKLSGFFIILTFSFGSCNNKPEKQVENNAVLENENMVSLTDAQFRSAHLQISEMEKRNVAHVIKLSGTVEVMPQNMVTLSSPVNGFIKKIKLRQGMTVMKGQMLVYLQEKEFIQLQQDYLSAKTSLAFSKINYERQKELSHTQAVSEKAMQMAEAEMHQFQIQTKSLSEKLKLIHINPVSLTAENMTAQISLPSSASGMISELYVNSGKYVHVGDDILKILENGGSRLMLKAFEKDLFYLNEGQKIKAFANTKPERKFSGRIEYIVRNINSDGFANIVCIIDNASLDIMPGMYMNAEIEAQSIESWTLPVSAVVNFEGKEYVFLDMGNKTYQLAEIKTGIMEANRIQILNYDIFINKKIVVQEAYTLLMKMKNVTE